MGNYITMRGLRTRYRRRDTNADTSKGFRAWAREAHAKGEFKCSPTVSPKAYRIVTGPHHNKG